jgi:hypothetical protein
MVHQSSIDTTGKDKTKTRHKTLNCEKSSNFLHEHQ